MYLPVPRRFLRRLGTAHDGDHLAECPLLDEVIMSLHAQRYAHSAVRPIDLAHDLCLDLFILLGKGSQDHIADLQPLYFQLDRHEAMLCLCESRCTSSIHGLRTGNDVIYGASGDHVIIGGPGNDKIDGGSGFDLLHGDAGNDSFAAKDGARDTVVGGGGKDRGIVDKGKDVATGVEKLS
jgi:hypothetical protein